MINVQSVSSATHPTQWICEYVIARAIQHDQPYMYGHVCYWSIWYHSAICVSSCSVQRLFIDGGNSPAGRCRTLQVCVGSSESCGILYSGCLHTLSYWFLWFCVPLNNTTQHRWYVNLTDCRCMCVRGRKRASCRILYPLAGCYQFYPLAIKQLSIPLPEYLYQNWQTAINTGYHCN